MFIGCNKINSELSVSVLFDSVQYHILCFQVFGDGVYTNTVENFWAVP